MACLALLLDAGCQTFFFPSATVWATAVANEPLALGLVLLPLLTSYWAWALVLLLLSMSCWTWVLVLLPLSMSCWAWVLVLLSMSHSAELEGAVE